MKKVPNALKSAELSVEFCGLGFHVELDYTIVHKLY